MDVLLSVLGMLTIVVLMLVAAHYVTRWVAGRGAIGGAVGQEDFRVVRQLSLGRDARLALVRIGKRCVLLGITPNAVSLLLELTEEEAERWEEKDASPPPSFLEALRENLAKKK